MKRTLTSLALFLTLPACLNALELRTQLGDVKDTRTTGKFFAGLEVELKLLGDALGDAKGIRSNITKAVDDSGRDLLNPERFEKDFRSISTSGGGERVTLKLKNPTRRAAEIKELSGTLELHIPAADPNATVTIDSVHSAMGKPLEAPGLKSAGVEIVVLNKKQFDAFTAAEKEKQEKKREQMRSRRMGANAPAGESPKPGLDNPDDVSELAEALGAAFVEAFSGMFGGFMSMSDRDVAFLTKDPQSRIISMEVQTADGKKVATRGTSYSGNPDRRTKVLHFEQAVPADARLLIYLASEKSIVTVPFQLNSIPLP